MLPADQMSEMIIVDALSSGIGRRVSSRDSIGCGPRTVAGVLEKNGVGCRIKMAEELLSVRSVDRKFQHLALSAMTMDLPAAKRVISSWRKSRPGGRVLVGGPISSDPSLVMTELRPDVVVIGEGEGTLEELLRKGFLSGETDLSSVKGIAYRRGANPIVTGRRPLLSANQMSDEYIPSITRTVDYPAYQADRVYVEVVRGCSNLRRARLRLPDGRKCSDCGNCDSDDPAARIACPENIPPGCGFCSVPATWGPPRSRSPDAIVEEVRGLLDLGVHRIVLEAPDFLDYMRGNGDVVDPCEPPANLDAIDGLLGSLAVLPQLADGSVHIDIENMKACLLNDEVCDVISRNMKEIRPNIGLETGSQQHMREIGKCGTPADVVRAVRIAKEHGMHPFVYLIYGLPGESEQTVDESVRLMRELDKEGAQRIILYGFRPLPGSAFEQFPTPSLNAPLTRRMLREAERINRAKKAQYVGRVIRGVAAEPSWARHGHTMVYPLADGPMMTVQGGYSPGTVLDVRITDILSPNLVMGEALHSSQ